MLPTIEYGSTKLGKMRVETAIDEKTKRSVVSAVVVDDEVLAPSDRFWTSLYVRYGFGKSFFDFFSYEEVFTRIASVTPQDRLRFCVERDPASGKGQLLAVSSPSRPIIHYEDLSSILSQYQGERISYHDGIVESHHLPRQGQNKFQIAGDNFSNRFVMRTPVDGYGRPCIYLAMLREVCSNGMIGMSPVFRSEISMGRGSNKSIFSLTRAMEGFNNDEGYAALRQRFESASASWASVYEAVSLYKVLAKVAGQSRVGSDGVALTHRSRETTESIMNSFHKLTGDVSQLYGLANLDSLSAKRQRMLPVNCKVYDLLNFATEVATHLVVGRASHRLQAWVGTLVSSEFDLEGTADRYGDFLDFFTDENTRKALDGPAGLN